MLLSGDSGEQSTCNLLQGSKNSLPAQVIPLHCQSCKGHWNLSCASPISVVHLCLPLLLSGTHVIPLGSAG